MSLVSAAFGAGDLQIVTQIHGLVVKYGHDNSQRVESGLIEMYIDVHCVDDAYCIFCEMPVKDVVAWTLMLTGYVKSGNWNKAVEHFNQMLIREEVELDSVALIGILSGCGNRMVEHFKWSMSINLSSNDSDQIIEGKVPKDCIALRMLAEEMTSWTNLEVEASKKNRPSKSRQKPQTPVSIQKQLPCGSTWTGIQRQRLRRLMRAVPIEGIWSSVLGVCIPHHHWHFCCADSVL
ncbi:hypothetical protein K7X08_017590 [Anisodus acutangulus]|uniref:Pentatricopeptide repeat-containing protein n=1 Tax=Anisodus acutangulus TaxID=402998 RepID=A0A9Q1LUF5_9SOLA|nr:hypothetical protein K7X08_017590 [Anisodus acutangulus]